MQIKVSVRHGQLTEEKQEHIKAKAEKLLHFFERLTMIEVVVDLKKEEPLVEFLVQAEHKHNFVAQERNKEIYAAVDIVMEKMEAQLRKYKQKLQDHRRTPTTGDVASAGNNEPKTDEEREAIEEMEALERMRATDVQDLPETK